MQIGIDLGGSHIAVGIISERNTIIAKREIDIEKDNIVDIKQYIVENIKILISQVLKDVGAPSCVITKIGIATPGKVKDNVIYEVYNLGIKEFNLCEILTTHYAAEVTARNDAKCAALAEKELGSLKEYEDCVFLCLGTGIGGATFINGRMLEYTKDFGSEYGHMIIQKDGRECKCGNKGCFETYCSMKAFKQGAIKLLNLNENIESVEIVKILEKKLETDDEIVKNYIDEYLEDLLIGISNIENILDPEAISLGGSFTYFKDILYRRLIQKLNEKKYNSKIPAIVLASLKNDAGMIGALL